MSQRIKTVKEFLKEEDDFKMWQETGLFVDLSFMESHALYLKLKEMTELMVSERHFPINVECLVIPIVVKCYKSHNHLINSCRVVLSYVRYSKCRLVNLSEFAGVDVEATFCALMAEEISELKL